MFELRSITIHGGSAHFFESISLWGIVGGILVVAVTVGLFVAIGSRVSSFSDPDRHDELD